MVDNNINRVEEESGEAFVIGEIEGMSSSNVGRVLPTQQINNEEVRTMTTTVEQVEKKVVEVAVEVDPKDLEGTYTLKINRKFGSLLDLIKTTNSETIIQDKGDYFQINAEYLAINRRDVERIAGKMTTGAWRMLVMNHSTPSEDGVVTLTNDSFVMGETEEKSQESVETAQINVRVSANVKKGMDETRALLGNMTQTVFLEEAISEYVAKVKAELL